MEQRDVIDEKRVQAYLELDGVHCPYCGSQNIESGHFDSEGKCQEVECHNLKHPPSCKLCVSSVRPCTNTRFDFVKPPMPAYQRRRVRGLTACSAARPLPRQIESLQPKLIPRLRV
jgi:hypothetical protein